MSINVETRDGHEISDYWRLCEEFTLKQAVLLFVGCDPSTNYGCCESWLLHDRPPGYEAAKQAFKVAVRDGFIAGKYLNIIELNIDGFPINRHIVTTDLDNSIVERASLVDWLKGRGIKSGFFFPNDHPKTEPDFLDPRNPRYAPKLAAAVRAWQAVTDPKGKSPKQALEKWLREHAAEFGQSDDDGNPINKAMEECSTVANWQPKGGAAKTPGA